MLDYFIADSLGDSRINHYRVKELQSLLEGKDYVNDGSFDEWIAEVRPASLKNSNSITFTKTSHNLFKKTLLQLVLLRDL